MIATGRRLGASVLTAAVVSGVLVVSPVVAPSPVHAQEGSDQETVEQEVGAPDDQRVEVAAVEFSDGAPVVTTTLTATPDLTVEALEDDVSVVADVVQMYQPSGVIDPDPLLFRQWGLERIDADGAHTQGATGEGIIVAVLDTGIDATHTDLAGVIDAQLDFVPGEGGGVVHGTSVAGIIAAQRNGSGIEGVAPGVRLLDARVCGSRGCPSDAVARAVIWSVAEGADVINMSLGGGVVDHTLGAVIDWATMQGVVVVAAAGNAGCSTSETYCTSTHVPTEWPAAFPTAIAVAAVHQDDLVPSYSSYGDYVDIAAPAGVLTLRGPYWSTFAGTSASAPHVAGVAALVLDANPNMSAAQVQAVIQSSATPPAVTPTHVLRVSSAEGAALVSDLVAPRKLVGAGVVSASQAVAAAVQIAQTDPIGQMAVTTTSSSITATWEPVPGAALYVTSIDAQDPIMTFQQAPLTVTFDDVPADVEFAVTTTAFDANGFVVARFASQLTTVASGTAPAAPIVIGASSHQQSTFVTLATALPASRWARLVRVGVGPVAANWSTGAASVGFGYTLTDAASAQFQVAVVDAAGRVSAYSSPFTVTTWSGATMGTPQNFTVTTLSATSVELTWDAVAGATYYQLQDFFRNTNGTPGNRVITTTATSWVMAGLDPGVAKATYVEVVSAANNPLSYRADAWFTPLPEPLPAPEVTAVGSPGSIDVTWTEVVGATAANVFRADGYAYGSGGDTATFHDLYIADSSAAPQVGEAYTYRVQLVERLNDTMSMLGDVSAPITATLGAYTTPAPACTLDDIGIHCTVFGPAGVQVVETRLTDPSGTVTEPWLVPVGVRLDYAAAELGVWTFEVRALEPVHQQRWTPWAATTATRSTVPVTTPPATTTPPNTAPPVTTPPVITPPVTAPPVTAPPVTTPPVIAPPTAPVGFTSVSPSRLFDTRPGNSGLRQVSSAKVSGGYILEVKATDLAGLVPASGVAAVSLNVTATGTEAAGFVTVYPCGPLKEVSSLNYAEGQTVANAVIAPVSASGTICLYSQAPTHLIVDVNGWFATGSSFTSVSPSRLFDTRPGNSGLRQVSSAKVSGGYILEVKATDLAGLVPASGVAAVSLNVTATGTEAAGFVTVYPCGPLKEVSSLNYAEGQTVANAVIAPVSASGTICLYSQAPTHLIVDVNGWFRS